MKKIQKRTGFTILAMLNIIWYTVVVIVASFHDHEVPNELTISWFSAWTIELALLFGIKVKSKDADYDERYFSDVINNLTGNDDSEYEYDEEQPGSEMYGKDPENIEYTEFPEEIIIDAKDFKED